MDVAKNEVMISKINYGKFGRIEASAKFFRNGIDQKIMRYNQDYSKSLDVEIGFFSRVDNSAEEISIKPQVSCEKDWKVSFWLRRFLSDKNQQLYRFCGFVGMYGSYPHGVPISEDMYNVLRSKMIKMCNINHPYEIDEFVEVVRILENPDIIEMIEIWDRINEVPKKEQTVAKLIKNLHINNGSNQ